MAYAADGEVNQREIEALISIAAGRPLTEEETAATIRNLYGTRLFSNVVVDAEPVESGDVRVIIYLWRAYVVRGDRVRGQVRADPGGPPARRAARGGRPVPRGVPRGGHLRDRAPALRRRLPRSPGRARGRVRPGDLHGHRALPHPGRTAGPDHGALLRRQDGALHGFGSRERPRQARSGRRLQRGQGPRRRRAHAEISARPGLLPRRGRADRRRADRGRTDPAGLPDHRGPALRDRGRRDQAQGGGQADPGPAGVPIASTRTCSISGPSTGAPSCRGRATTA